MSSKHGGNVVGVKTNDAERKYDLSRTSSEETIAVLAEQVGGSPYKDMVDKPSHYHQGAIECIAYIEGQLTEEQFKGYLTGSLYKYVHRFQYKNGLEDLKKARWFLNKLIDMEG